MLEQMQTEPSLIFKEIPYLGDGYQDVVAIRQAVLRTPIGLTLKEEEKQADEGDVIIGAMCGSKMVGCIIIRKHDETTCRLRQIAVLEEEQNKGYGKSMIHFAEDLAKKSGFKNSYLFARHNAVQFYYKLGYRVVGEPFIEVGMPHIKMEKSL